MKKSKKETKGMLWILLGMLFSITSSVMISVWKDSGFIPVIVSFLGIIVIVYGLFQILKANRKNKGI